MRVRAGVGWVSWLLVLSVSATAQANTYAAASLGWSRTAHLPGSRVEAERLLSKAREPLAFPATDLAQSGERGRSARVRYSRWLDRVTDAAARASAWYLTELVGPEPFVEQLRQRAAVPDERPLPQLGPGTAAYVILGEISEIEWRPLASAIGPPRPGITAEQYIATLAMVGFLFDDIASAVGDVSARGAPEYVGVVDEVTRPISKALLWKCRLASTSLQTWTSASRRCEEWLGKRWQAELSLTPLDELLPSADRVPLPRFGFAPVGLAAGRRRAPLAPPSWAASP